MTNATTGVNAEATLLPGQLGPLETGPITFKSGVPVGGWAQLTLHQNGAYNFTGHFRNSGAPPYRIGCVVAIRDAKGTAYTFSVEGTAHGLDPGSRNFDWNKPGTNPALAAGWSDFFRAPGNQWSWGAEANVDISTITEQVLKALPLVTGVIAVL
jgi:hypothetical protein